MTGTPTGRPGMKRRTTLLIATFVMLLLIVVGRQLRETLPYSPRLAFKNEFDDIDHLVISDGTVSTDLGRVKKGNTVVLPLTIRSRRRYSVLGRALPSEELRRVVEIAGRERRDVDVEIDFHGCLVLESHEYNGFVVR